MQNNISLISTFGPEVRGISPYSDELFRSLVDLNSLPINAIDYDKVYPDFLVPMFQPQRSLKKNAIIHYAKPSSWKKCSEICGKLTHIQYWSPFTSYCLFQISKKIKKKHGKIVITVHNPTSHEVLPLFRQWEFKLLQMADHIIVHSDSGKKLLLETNTNLSSKSISVIPHGIRLKRNSKNEFSKNRDYETCRLDCENDYLLFFGNIRKYKGVRQLIEVWKEIQPDIPNTKLIIAGRLWEGSNPISNLAATLLGSKKEAKYIKSLLPTAESLNIIFRLGFISGDQLDAYCRIAKLGIFPYTKFSGQSGAASLAASWGLPVLVPKLGALDQLAINDGYIISPDQPKSFANSIINALEETESSHRAKQLAVADSFSWDKVAQQHMFLYEQVMNNY